MGTLRHSYEGRLSLDAGYRWPMGVVLVIVAIFGGLYLPVWPGMATGPDVEDLVTMANSGQGAEALQIVAQTALEVGGWAPAPGYTIVYDLSLARGVRGAVQVVDQPPVECANPRLSRGLEACVGNYSTRKNQVRFGQWLFENPLDSHNGTPRPAFDDVLSTYIEEVGHSWQEYLFETGGAGTGIPVRMTSWEDGLYWAHGWEYQVKAYILNLDGDLIFLSNSERTELKSAVCNEENYAYPVGHHAPPLGPPPGWPNPQDWPLTAPTRDELRAWCDGH